MGSVPVGATINTPAPSSRPVPVAANQHWQNVPKVVTAPVISCQPDFAARSYQNAVADFNAKQRMLTPPPAAPRPAPVDPETQLRTRLNNDSRLTASRITNCNNFLTAVVPDVRCHQMTLEDLKDAILNRNTFNLFDPGSSSEYQACQAIFYGYVGDIYAEEAQAAQRFAAENTPAPQDPFLQNASLLDLARNVVKAEKMVCSCIANPSDRPQGAVCE
jgi:hypothetical protein